MAQAKFYRNKASGDIYAAMSSPDGYEDAHPEAWEPVTDEVAAAPPPPKAKAKAEPKPEPVVEEPAVPADEFPPAPADFVPPPTAIPPAPRRQ